MLFSETKLVLMQKFFIAFLLIFSLNSMLAQTHIEFNISNYQSDTVVVGYYLLDKQLVQDTLISSDHNFILESEEMLEPGVYLLLLNPDQTFIQFLVNDDDQEFKLSMDYQDPSHLIYEGSSDNELLQNYIDDISAIRPTAQKLRDTIDILRSADEDFSMFETELEKLDAFVDNSQSDILEYHSETMAAMLIRSNISIDVPDFPNSENPKMDRYRYYKSHYFDNVNLSDPNSLRTPFLQQRVDYYITKLTPNHPDSIAVSVDSILSWMSPAPETFKYYLSYFLNKYAVSKVVGYDAVYVHIVDKYYATGMADWVDEENLAKIIDNANKIKPVLIGNIGENITVYDEFNNPMSIDDIDYEYLVLLFWSPDCPHCKKTMSQFIEFDKKWREKGVRTFAICSKHKDAIKECWEYVEEKDMLGFINGADEFHRSRFKIKYNVQTTPKIFILDKNREILMKNIGGDQLERVMEEILKVKALEEK